MIKHAKRAKKYRTRAEIIEDMLNASLDGANKTKLVYAGYMSLAQLKQYLPFVLQLGLLEYNAKQNKYFTTIKGREFLRKISDLKI